MTYSYKTGAYNDRRYSKPWMAFVTTSLTKDFKFIDWDGRPGSAGEFNFQTEPGTMVAYGQKDIRKGRGGVDSYQICMPDGSMPTVTDYAAELRKMDLTARWQEVARRELAWAVNRPAEPYKIPDWEKTRNATAAKYSAMLGVPNPVTAELAQGLGLAGDDNTEKPAAAPVIDMSDFGV